MYLNNLQPGDMVRHLTRSFFVGKVLAGFHHNGEQWWVGTTTENMLWLSPDKDLRKFECTTVQFVEKPNTSPMHQLSHSKA